MGHVIQVSKTGGSEELLAAEISKAARDLSSRAMRLGLPEDLCQQIQADAEEISMALKKMVPSTRTIDIKLELMGENVCARWHQDYYVGRAIVTYNGLGTVYTRSSNVDFWALNNRGDDDHILHDNSDVFSANEGDILFMKGKMFPGAVKALVHKSPVKRYHADGAVMNRLCLKVDLPKPSPF